MDGMDGGVHVTEHRQTWEATWQ
jgi:hypothetical protein